MKEIVATVSEAPLGAISSLPPEAPEDAVRAAIAGLLGGKDTQRHVTVLKERLTPTSGRGTFDVLNALMKSAQGNEIPRETLEKMLTFLPPKRDGKDLFRDNSSFVYSVSSTLAGIAAFVNY